MRKVAEAVDTALLEKQATKEILSYSIDVIPDDRRIDVYETLNKPLKNINFTIRLNPDETDNSRQQRF